MSNENKDEAQIGITINGVGETPQWLKDEAEKEYPYGEYRSAFVKLSSNLRTDKYRDIHIKARMKGVEDSCDFADWCAFNYDYSLKYGWSAKGEALYNWLTTAQLFTIYQQQKGKI